MKKSMLTFAANLADDANEGMTPLSDLPTIPEGASVDSSGQNGGEEIVEQ